MKLTYLGLLCIFILQSCNYPVIEYENKELIKLEDFIDMTDNYQSLYSHKINNAPVSTSFRLKSKYGLLILNLGNCTSDLDVIHADNVFTRFSGFSAEIQGTYYISEYYYNAPLNKNINKIEILGDNVISVNNNDSIKSFHANFHELSLVVNDRQDSGVYLESYNYRSDKRDAEIMLYKKNRKLYLLILTSLKRGEKIKHGLLLDYVYAKKYNLEGMLGDKDNF
jgi:hypothetical protein